MFRNVIASVGLMCALVVAAPSQISAQQTTAGDDAKKAGQETKEAGKEAGRATKDAGKATGKATKSAAKKTAKETKDTAKKVEGAVTTDVSATCKDGTVQVGKTKTAACADHGGIQ